MQRFEILCVRQQLPVDHPGRVNRDMTDWVSQIDYLIESLCKYLIGNYSAELGLPTDASVWPDPRDLPSLWAFGGSYIAYEQDLAQRLNIT
jgi:hypothetical protein